MIINLLSFWFLIRFNERARKPIVSAMIYAFVVLSTKALYLIQQDYIGWVALSVTSAFIGAVLVFFILDHFQDSILLWVIGLSCSFALIIGGEYLLIQFKPAI